MLTEFEKQIADFAQSNRLFEESDKILLAVSGGGDSTALLHLTAAIKKTGLIKAEIICAHINHQLREGDSEADEAFAAAETARLNWPLVIKRIDVRSFAKTNKLSIETAGRQLRIEALIQIAQQNNCKIIATGHHKNDNTETIIHRLLRGTGFRGLCGILPKCQFGGDLFFVRPLLCVKKNEIVSYLNERGLRWRQDKTNFDIRYKRNFIRNKLLPILQKDCGKLLTDLLFELSQNASRLNIKVCLAAENAWRKLVEDVSEKRIVFNTVQFTKELPLVKIELIRKALTAIGSGEGNLRQEHFEEILKIAAGDKGGKQIQLPGGFVTRRERKRLIFELFFASRTEKPGKETCVQIEIGKQFRFANYLIDSKIVDAGTVGSRKYNEDKSELEEWLDFDKVNFPLTVRTRRDGDRFVPLGLTSNKKVGRFLSDARVSAELREMVLIISDAKRIIWAWPLRISDIVKVTNKTRKVLHLKIEQKKNE